MSKILIAGGAGFIGSHLCDRFLSDGNDVICVDNFISGSHDNVAHLIDNPHFTLIEQDIAAPDFTLNTLHSTSLDAILHFACPASPNPKSPVSYMSHPLETMMVSSVGSKNLLDLARVNNCQIIFASTSEVYGDPLVHPQTEDYRGNVSSTGPRACYDEGKRFMEALAFTYHREYGVKIKVLRIFNTYGSRMRLDDGRFTIGMVDALLNNKSFKLHGAMNTITRSFCYIDDLVSGIVKAVGSDEMIGQVVNLGNPTELTLAQALTIFEQVAGAKLVKDQIDTQPDDPSRRKPDITKAQKILSWEPKVDFATGMQKTLNYYRNL